MAEYATKDDVQVIVNKAVDDLSDIISRLAQGMHSELLEIKHDVTELKDSHNRLMNTLDTFLKRLDDIESDNHARDAQLARLERWIEQVADKTGVKLEY